MLATNSEKNIKSLSVELPPIVELSTNSKVKLPFWGIIDDVSANYHNVINNIKYRFLIEMQKVPFLFNFDDELFSEIVNFSFTEIAYNNVLNEGKWLSAVLCFESNGQKQPVEFKYSPFLNMNVNFYNDVASALNMLLPNDYHVTHELTKIIVNFVARFIDELYAQKPECDPSATLDLFHSLVDIIQSSCDENDVPLPFSTGFFEYVNLDKLSKMENSIIKLY